MAAGASENPGATTAGNERGSITAQARRVVDAIVNRVQPDAVIVFGSVGRGEAGPHSDIDVLVLMAEGTTAEWRAALAAAHSANVRTGIDLVVGRTGAIPEYAASLGLVYGVAIREGWIGYAQDQSVTRRLEQARSAPNDGPNGLDMVKRKQLRKEEAEQFLRKAGQYVESARATLDQNPEVTAELAHASIERSAKAVLIARGVPVEFTHDIERLAEILHGHGEKLPTLAAGTDWEQVTRHGTAGRYDNEQTAAREEAAEDLKLAERILEWGTRRCRLLALALRPSP